jgi:hypothetical protein
MIESRKFVAAAILFGLALIVAGLMLAPLNGGAHAAATRAEADIAAARIGGAFATISDATVDPAIAAAATRAQKGDLARAADCATATWPNIDASCLSTADGRPAPHVRTVTVGYQTGQSTTLLLRIPTAEIAQR